MVWNFFNSLMADWLKILAQPIKSNLCTPLEIFGKHMYLFSIDMQKSINTRTFHSFITLDYFIFLSVSMILTLTGLSSTLLGPSSRRKLICFQFLKLKPVLDATLQMFSSSSFLASSEVAKFVTKITS